MVTVEAIFGCDSVNSGNSGWSTDGHQVGLGEWVCDSKGHDDDHLDIVNHDHDHCAGDNNNHIYNDVDIHVDIELNHRPACYDLDIVDVE